MLVVIGLLVLMFPPILMLLIWNLDSFRLRDQVRLHANASIKAWWVLYVLSTLIGTYFLDPAILGQPEKYLTVSLLIGLVTLFISFILFEALPSKPIYPIQKVVEIGNGEYKVVDLLNPEQKKHGDNDDILVTHNLEEDFSEESPADDDESLEVIQKIIPSNLV